jgi:glycosyltransferase involved in cell wall biosynthesis
MTASSGLRSGPDPGAESIAISVVLPVYNERGHLDAEITRIKLALEEAGLTYEIIVVDDGSTDGSGEALLARDDIVLIRFATNRGSGAARKAGTRAARAPIVVWTDVDMTYPNSEIPRLVKELDGYDQVVGARTSEQGTLKALRVPAKALIRWLASYLSGTRIPDLNSGLRAFRKDVAEQFLHLLPAGFSCVTTMTMTFLANGYSVKFTPIDYAPRVGRSKFHWWRDTRRYLLQVLRMVLIYNPLRVFMPIGLTLGLIGLVKMGFDLARYHFHVASDTLVVLLAAMGLVIVGLLADLIVQLNRPKDEVEPTAL